MRPVPLIMCLGSCAIKGPLIMKTRTGLEHPATVPRQGVVNTRQRYLAEVAPAPRLPLGSGLECPGAPWSPLERLGVMKGILGCPDGRPIIKGLLP